MDNEEEQRTEQLGWEGKHKKCEEGETFGNDGTLLCLKNFLKKHYN